VVSDTMRVDGVVPKGWQFHKFVLNQGHNLYQGVVAEFLGEGEETTVVSESKPVPWLHLYDAASFVERAIQELQQ